MGRPMISLRAMPAPAIPGCSKPAVSAVNWPVSRVTRCAALGCLLVLGVAAYGQTGVGPAAADGRRDGAASKADGQAPKRSNTVRVLPGGSGETPAERSARLKRECKGRPDAGACSGHTQ